ncbi:carboxymuconolactone decarboxylase family protein [Pseudonocardia eucalypti]|uniref:Carboxymuconolactone decarboxylase family protein n=1 Tax=Pseudonocardia eucalypti TaxID=648755 RepID=A0ABP9RE96_9PSEU|nr:AhpD family alkylhydroperoxidase [Pseudonocardia eucalypti]
MLDRAFRRQIRYVTPVPAGDLARRVSAQITRDVGAVVPPYALHLPAPEVLAASWAITREPVFGAALPRVLKEAVGAAVSATNACPYCVDVHTSTMSALDRSRDGEALAAGRDDRMTDPRLRALVGWARATRSPGSPLLADPPFSAAEAPEVIGTALGYHYINRMVSVFLVESPFPTGAGGAVKRALAWLARPVLRASVRRTPLPGAALEFLPDTGRWSGWAGPDPVIGAAFAGAAELFERAGRRVLAEPVRELVLARLAGWSGERPPLSRGWVEDAVHGLPDALRAEARLALLTALAPYQVDADVIDGFRAGEEALVAATGWASFAATRRVADWI